MGVSSGEIGPTVMGISVGIKAIGLLNGRLFYLSLNVPTLDIWNALLPVSKSKIILAKCLY